MRILVSKPDSLGDQLIAAGWLQALAAARPEAPIVWHVRAGLAPVAGLLAHVEIFQADRAQTPAAEAARLAAAHPRGLVLVPYPLDPYEEWNAELDTRLRWWTDFIAAQPWSLALAAVGQRTWVAEVTVAASRAPRRLGAAAGPTRQIPVNAAGHFLSEHTPIFTEEIPWDFDHPEAASMGRLLAATLADPAFATATPPPAHLRVRPSTFPARERHVLLAPGVGGPAPRAWPAAKFLALAERLQSTGWSVAWIEGPTDAPFFATLPDHLAGGQRHRFSGDELPALAALLESSAALVCNDTAYAHLAALLDVPTLAIYGGGQRGRFHPQSGRVKVIQGLPACSGCQWHCIYQHYPCVAEISVEAVLSSLDRLLAHDADPVKLTEVPGLAHSPSPALVTRLQHEILHLDADRFARLQIIQTLLDQARHPPAPPQPAALAPPRSHPPLPRISVIVPMGRPERAEPTLRALAAQTLHPPEWEVIVVSAEVEKLPPAATAGLPFRAVKLVAPSSPSQTRIAGVAEATGEWLWFIDDDIELAPNFFERALMMISGRDALSQPSRVGAIGACLPGRTGGFWEKTTDVSNFWTQQGPVPRTCDWLYSATLLVRAEAYRAAGGFNPAYPVGEDVDLTQRIAQQGFTLLYEPALVAYHHHRRNSPGAMWRYFWQNGNAAKFFFRIVGRASVFSLKTVWIKTWSDLRMNRDFQKQFGRPLGLRAPLVWLNYLIVETSVEWHWQQHLSENDRFRERPVHTVSDATYVQAMEARRAGRRFHGALLYLRAMLQDFRNPVQR